MSLKNIVIKGDLALCLPQMDDAHELYELVKNQKTYLGLWMSWIEIIQNLEDAKIYVFDVIRFNEGGQHITLFIKKNTELIGSVVFMKVSKMHQKAELGYWLDQSYQGQGIMQAALKTFISFGYLQKDLNKIELKISSENTRSRRLASALGFQQEGLLRKDFKQKEKFLDLAVYGLLRDDWKKNMQKTNNL